MKEPIKKISFSKRLLRLRHKMRMPSVSLRLLMLLIGLLLFAKLVEKNVLFSRFDQRHAERIQKIFTQKEHALNKYVDEIKQCTETSSDNLCFINFHYLNEKKLKKQGIYLFAYQDDTLKYWSTKDVTAARLYSEAGLDNPYVSLNNGRYASFIYEYDQYKIVGLILIKNVYLYENKYLKTGFQKDFKLPPNVKIFPGQESNSYPITDTKGQFMWSLIFDDTCHYDFQTYIPAFAYFLAILIFFLLIDTYFQRLRNRRLKNWYLPLFTIVLFSLRYAMQRFGIPPFFDELKIFDPIHFGSRLFSSLGELFLWTLFVCFYVIELYRNISFPIFYEKRWKFFSYVILSLLLVILFFFSTGLIIDSLVINSSNTFEGPNKILLLNGYSLLGYVIIMLCLLSFCLLMDKVLILCKQEIQLNQFFILYIIVLSLVIIGWSFAKLHIYFFSIIILTAMIGILGMIRLRKNTTFKYFHFVLIVFVLSVYVTLYINRCSIIKYEDQKKVIVTNLASPHDLTSESLLRDIDDKIINDTTLTNIMYENRDLAIDYLQRKYFNSPNWNPYNYQCVICDEEDTIYVRSEQRYEHCIRFFKGLIEKYGTQIIRSDFYHINRPETDQYASFLGWYRKEKDDKPPLYVYPELWAVGNTDESEIGYPELLLDSRTSKDNNLKGYSYAKYKNNGRISQFGGYKYNLKGDIFQTDKSDYHTVIADGMEHLVYRPDKHTMIVLSSYFPKFVDYIINFSFIFIFSFLVVSGLLILFYLPIIQRSFLWDFRNKIQFSMITITLVSFGIIGTYTIFYINRQYQEKNNDSINDKMQSVHYYLNDLVVLEKMSHTNWTDDNNELVQWLTTLRSTFFTDINLFDAHGKLIATSLPEIFDKGLISKQINPNAFIKLTFGQKASIIEKEDIGKLSYSSVYEPIIDGKNDIIAFLNLPYFTQQDDLREEISSVVLAITNFYMVIILLTVIISIVVSNQITQPLIMLQEKFRNIKLGEKNEPIRYNKNDEIGGLVKEYNRAIEELAQSASRLARSERESAWREMAKQIAHEINNPLTPMKLSIQHLKRAWDNKSERFNEYMEKISHSLVEQIDALSFIATEFSNFAKMPVAQNQLIDIITRIDDVVPLFATGDNKRAFHIDYHGLQKATIYADKEQISRVFINLFKNALQAIPKDRQANIHIDVLKLNQMIWIRIKDNGMGIPEEMQEKIFRPNFTTKSSGMGLGLTIVRNIIESTGGTISFRTKQNEGTTFIISFPSAGTNE